jgi:KaiC/GvpD/RAD55 family RecA-like ATPase
VITSIELQMICRILTSDNDDEINSLCSYDESYYSVFKDQIHFILEHRQKYGNVPDVFTFQAEFPNVTLIKVSEPLAYLKTEIAKNKQHILLLETFNKLKDLGSGDVSIAWEYLQNQCDLASQLDETHPLDIVKEAHERAQQVVDFSKQERIPTGFAEIDKLMYGGLSTVEELALVVARTNNGKSWLLTKMMESAQKNGFPVLYYSPEMQASFLGTRFDTWRQHFQNNQLFQGKYTTEYMKYLDKLSQEETSALVLEDKNTSEGVVNVRGLESLVRRHHIRLLIIDGLSYMTDTHRSDTDYMKYKNLCTDLFRLSKQFGCAVVVAMQANRETKECKDDKGDPFPTIYNVEGSDHPARIATQVFTIRQIFDKHVLDIRLEKSRNANNQKPVLSYAWDINTGNMQYLPTGGDTGPGGSVTPTVAVPSSITKHVSDDTAVLEDDFEDDENVEF